MRNEQAEKLDVMMTVCLRHFHGVCHSKGEWSVRCRVGGGGGGGEGGREGLID